MDFVRCARCDKELPGDFRFCGYCGVPLAEPAAANGDYAPTETLDAALAAPLSDMPTAEVSSQRDERRYVAVLFADLRGFTDLSDRLDPEEVHAVMNECFAGFGRAIHEEGGFIDKYIGDSVMAIFGAPVAHEDDPVRACASALAMQRFLREFSSSVRKRTGTDLHIRIGIHYGLVVAGGVGSNVKMQYTVMGDTVNVASRLESSAEPGSILVSKEVRDACGEAFEYGEQKKLKVKGKRRRVIAFELRAEQRGRATRYGLTSAPLVGRDEELAALLARLNGASADHRWIELRGDLGSGKSRLLREAVLRRHDRHFIEVLATPATRRRPFGLVEQIIHDVLVDLTFDTTRLESADRFTRTLLRLDRRLEPYRPTRPSRTRRLCVAPSSAASRRSSSLSPNATRTSRSSSTATRWRTTRPPGYSKRWLGATAAWPCPSSRPPARTGRTRRSIQIARSRSPP
jgi:class 3 adenylate cyclase